MTSKFLKSFCLAIVCWLSTSDLLLSQPAGTGLYVIWYHTNTSLLDAPYIVGGQVVVQWRDVDQGNGNYDFSVIGKELKMLKEKGKKTTIQINGNRKPEWLFSKVPYYPGKLSVQVSDEKGTLMYWHPGHEKAYLEMLSAFGSFLEKCDDRDAVLGIRLNFNAIGTEHMSVPAEARDLQQWIIPEGTSFVVPWSAEISKDYEHNVVSTFIEKISPHVRVFVRNSVKPEIEEQYRSWFEQGRLAWFQTSSEAEPHTASTEIQYRRFIQYCRSGKTVGYAEPWASGWGDHGNPEPDDRWCSPPQWNYWRLLLDLHCGVSFIALYANDLNVAITGKYSNKYDENKDKLGYQQEFEEAFRFADRYVGYHNLPEKSPGAWVAFRSNDTILAKNKGIAPAQRKLTYLTGDYNFLMERLPDKTIPVHNIGPDEQRFGAWAEMLPAGEGLKINVNEQFAKSLDGGVLKIIYLLPENSGKDKIKILTGKKARSVNITGTGRWETAEVLLSSGSLNKAEDGSLITITAGLKPLYLHMVEINRIK